MKKLVFILFMIIIEFPCFTQQLYFGFRTDANGNVIYQKAPDPIIILYLKNDNTFYLFQQRYENNLGVQVYNYDTKHAFTPQIRTSIISKGKIETKKDQILLNDLKWKYTHLLNINNDSTLIYRRGMIYLNNWKFIDYKRLFNDCKEKEQFDGKISQFESSIVTDSVCDYPRFDSLNMLIETYLQSTKRKTSFPKKEIYKDSLSKIRIEFEENNYKIIYEPYNQLFSIGKVYSSLNYILLDDEEVGRDYIIKFITDSEFELIYYHPILLGLQITIPFVNDDFPTWQSWKFKKIDVE